jgi:Uma2 family endonuclease
MVAERITQPESHAPDSSLLTAEEYFATCHLERSELVNGKVVELMPPGFDHGTIASNISALLRAFVRQGQLGRVSVEGGFRLRRGPDMVRSPDVSFIETSRLEGITTQGFIEGAPTLAVEVVSPNDLWSEVEEKVREYLHSGTLAVWIVDPETQTVTVRTREAAPVVYASESTLRGAPVLPGFEVPVSEIFDL